MKDFIEKLIKEREAEFNKVSKRLDESTDTAEVKMLGETLLKLKDEITEAETKLKECSAPQEEQMKQCKPDDEKRGLNPMASYETRKANPRGSMEYRQAFMEYVQHGTVSDKLQFRDGSKSADLGVLIPTTVMQEIVKGVEKVYGQLYSRVKKTNIKGGVKYPIASFDAVFTRIKEGNTPSDRKKGIASNSYVEFSYKIGEVRIAQNIVVANMEIPMFESELAKTIVEAYLKAMDYEILNGDVAQDQMEGLLKSDRIPSKNVIEFTEAEMADWTKWQTKLFAKIPVGMRGLSPEFVMTPNTYEANIKTLKDGNDRPVYNETFNPIDGAETATFKGKQVMFVEEGNGLSNFDDALNGEYFGIYWVPEKAYAVNTNMEFAVKRYFDEEKLEWVDRAVIINDGKVLDPQYVYLLKKKV